MTIPWKHTTTLLALALLLSATQALASVAANTRIFTEATLNYDDGTGTIRTSTASATVTIALVPAKATLGQPADGGAVYSAIDTATAYAYTVTAGGNGPDNYTLAVAVTDSSNTDNPSASIQNIASLTFTLGASVTTVGSDQTNILLPSDGVSDGNVNGIAVGDMVVINDEIREVESVHDPATGTATIVLKTPLTEAAPVAGVSVHEQRSFVVEVLSGTIQAMGENITVMAETSVTNSGGELAAQVLSTFTSGAAVLTKFARNVTNGAANTGGTGNRSFTVNGATAIYYTGGTTAVGGDVIEYLLLVENKGTATVDGCNIHDLLPVDYVLFQSGVFATKDFLYVDEAGAESTLTAAADTDTATVTGADMAFYLGTGATASAGGSIGPDKSVKVLYRVQVN